MASLRVLDRDSTNRSKWKRDVELPPTREQSDFVDANRPRRR